MQIMHTNEMATKQILCVSHVENDFHYVVDDIKFVFIDFDTVCESLNLFRNMMRRLCACVYVCILIA